MLLVPKIANARLRVPNQFFQTARALEDGLPVQVGGLRAFAMMERFFEQLLFPLLVARHAFDMVRESLFGLRLVSVQARQFFAQFGG
jgi:hypothetical protein